MKHKTKENEEPVSVGHRILTVVGAILCVILIPILIINCTLILKSYTNKDQVPSVGGHFPHDYSNRQYGTGIFLR